MADKSDDLVISVSTDLSTVQRGLRRLGADIDATAKGIQTRFAAAGKGIDKSMTTALQARINDMVGIGTKGVNEWTGALADQGKEFERLRMKINPVFAVITRYKASIAEIQTAHRLGAVSADEMATAIQRERQATLQSIAAIKQRNAVLADTPVRGGSFNTANIAAQFQDIGVTAAMGMSPLQIALQQGTQLSAVFEQLKADGRGIGASLGAAFASVISPVSLVTIGVVALSAAAIQYFSTFMEGSEESEKALKAQAELIQQVADKWGDALPSIKAYADEQERIANKTQIQDATAITVDKAWEQARTQIEDARASVNDLVQQLGLIPEYQHGVVDLQRAFNTLSDGVKDGKTETDDLERVSSALAALYNNTQIPVVNDLATAFANLSEQIAKANQATTLAKAEANLKDLQSNLSPLGTLSPVFSAGGKFIDESGLQSVRANATKSQFQLEQERAARRGGGAKTPKRTADDRFFEDIEAIKARTVALAEEQAQLGMSYEAQTKRKVAFDLEQKALRDVREEARKKGDQDWQNAQLSPDQIAKIDEVSDAYARQAQALRDAQVRQQDFQDWMNVGRDATRGFIDDLLNGASAGEAFANVLGKIGDKLLDLAMNDLFGGGNGGGTGLLGALLGGLGGGGASSGPLSWLDDMFRADGGPVSAGQPYIVGEKRPELFVPRTSGTIVPQVPSLVAAANDNGTTFAPVYHIDARGADAAAVARLEAGLNKTNREMQARIESGVRSAQKRNVKLG